MVFFTRTMPFLSSNEQCQCTWWQQNYASQSKPNYLHIIFMCRLFIYRNILKFTSPYWFHEYYRQYTKQRGIQVSDIKRTREISSDDVNTLPTLSAAAVPALLLRVTLEHGVALSTDPLVPSSDASVPSMLLALSSCWSLSCKPHYSSDTAGQLLWHSLFAESRVKLILQTKILFRKPDSVWHKRHNLL